MQVKFWGAAKTVTGSMHLITLSSGTNILLDCGLYQGGGWFADEANTSFPIPPSQIDMLILSHAHIDHSGNIPQLVKRGFKGKVYCTHATYDLCSIMLRDSGRIQESDAMHENKYRLKQGLPAVDPIYTEKDVVPALSRFVALAYDHWHQISDEVEVMFRDAGHLLGSASVTLTLKDKGEKVRFGFTGDIGREERQILKDPQPMPQVKYLISESTYGGEIHESADDRKEKLLDVIHRTCVQNGGKLIIPAFSIGRTQNIVHNLDQLENEGRLPRIPVFVDSPLAVNATAIYNLHPECFDEELNAYMETDPNPFGFNTLHYIREVQDSKKLNDYKGPCVIISASGMATAGRILHHLYNHISDKNNTVLIVGYCAEGTIGNQLVNGYRRIKIFGHTVDVRAKIEIMNSFSAHGDQQEMLDFISSQDKDELERIFLVHGEPSRSEAFKKYLEKNGYKHVEIPDRGTIFDL